ncbi:polyprenyl synthetase family protein [Rariglobus hedericola]|uniref:Polyprenyl synthetase family protein n=1 Tax=Rariglobus hedericola TaxID=2597822 RepID=A0A556QJ82_9BACT|nr:polyprenyl synthetase family protein [Rariglobus hedericola]TSJ76696.1 polyprenyl synthetase family protein [Rariglobus hedericola]
MNSSAAYLRLCDALMENSPALLATDQLLRDTLTLSSGNPGKLIRARLVLAAADAHGLEEGPAERLACAVEYFHIASLLLDDLPCMDDAWTRRGRPCAHKLYGESSAILGALAFINRAYALTGFVFASHPAEIRLQATACLDACLGPAGLVGGQAADLSFAQSDRSAREVAMIAARKTGSLFWLAVYFPALLGAPSQKELHALKALCVYWGLAYQAADDLQDALLNAFESGKTAGRDRALTRPNLAHAIGVPATQARIARLMEQSRRVVERLGATSQRWGYLGGFHREFVEPMVCAVAA